MNASSRTPGGTSDTGQSPKNLSARAEHLVNGINGRATRRGLLAFVLSLLGPLLLLAFFAHRSGLAAAVPAHLAIPEEVLQIWGQTCDALVAPEPGAVASGRGAQSGVSSSSVGGDGSDGSADAPVAAAPSPEGMLTLFQLLLGTLYYGKPERRGC